MQTAHVETPPVDKTGPPARRSSPVARLVLAGLITWAGYGYWTGEGSYLSFEVPMPWSDSQRLSEDMVITVRSYYALPRTGTVLISDRASHTEPGAIVVAVPAEEVRRTGLDASWVGRRVRAQGVRVHLRNGRSQQATMTLTTPWW